MSDQGLEAITRVAVIKPCCIGDCVMALPALDALSLAFPTATRDAFIGRHSRAIFDTRQAKWNVVEIDDTFSMSLALSFGARLRRRDYDVIVLLDRSRWLRAAVRLSGARRTAAPRPRAPETRHESEVYLDVVRSLGIETPVSLPRIELECLGAGGPPPNAGDFVVLHAGGGENPGSRMPSKRWSEACWVSLAGALVAEGLQIVWTGSQADAERCRRIAGQLVTPTTVLAGMSSLTDTIRAVSRARLYVGPDTGLTHVAAALGVPTVAIFGPTNPQRYGPRGRQVAICAAPGSSAVIDRDLRRNAPVPEDARIELVTVDTVLLACRRLLGRAA